MENNNGNNSRIDREKSRHTIGKPMTLEEIDLIFNNNSQENKARIIVMEAEVRELKKELNSIEQYYQERRNKNLITSTLQTYRDAFILKWLRARKRIQEIQREIEWREREIQSLRDHEIKVEEVHQKYNLDKQRTQRETHNKVNKLELEVLPSKWKYSLLDDLDIKSSGRTNSQELQREKEILTQLHHKEAKINGKILEVKLRNQEIEKLYPSINGKQALQRIPAEILKIYNENQAEIMKLEKQRVEALHNSRIQAQKVMRLEKSV